MTYFMTPLAFLAEATESAAEPSGIAKLGLHPLNLLLQVLTVVILLVILNKYAFGPIVAMLEKRRQTIEDGIRLGREMEAEKTRAQEAIAKELRKARQQADAVISAAHEEAGEVMKDATQTAEAKAAALFKDAQNRIEQEAKVMRESIKTEVLGLVADATEVIIDEKLDPAKDAKLIQKALQGASQ